MRGFDLRKYELPFSFKLQNNCDDARPVNILVGDKYFGNQEISYNMANVGNGDKVSVESMVDGVSYSDLLYHFNNSSARIRFMYLEIEGEDISKSVRSLESWCISKRKHYDGNGYSEPIKLLRNPFFYRDNLLMLNCDFVLDEFTGLKIISMAPKTTAYVYLFPRKPLHKRIFSFFK